MREGRVGRGELAALVAVVGLAALLRFADLPTRGTWDADQGNDMLTLWRLVHEGAIPLLGPPTSIGDFHHGVLYYYLLAPAAFLSGADPLAIVGFIALCGVAAVAVVWWLGRSIGGPVAGLVAAGAMAVSASAIEESTFIWNPNLIALSSAIALAAAWRAWTTRRAGWWVIAAAAQAVTMHGHVLGAVLVVPLAALLVADARRRAPGGERRDVAGASIAGLAVVALSYVPLLIHELTHDLAETRAAVDFLTAGSGAGATPLPGRLALVPLRVLSWPLTGLITDHPVPALVAAAAVVAVLAWLLVAAAPPERTAARWFAFTLAWSAAALAIGATSLASVVPGLPNDHYHAFLDPIVFVTVGLGVAGLWRTRPRPRASVTRQRLAPPATADGRVLAIVAVATLAAFNAANWPAAHAPDGGYPAALAAAERIRAAIGEDDFQLVGQPALKNTHAYGFPLRRLGLAPGLTKTSAGPSSPRLVVVCDRLLERIIRAACGGPAEDQVAAGEGRVLVERFPASPRTVISIYR